MDDIELDMGVFDLDNTPLYFACRLVGIAIYHSKGCCGIVVDRRVSWLDPISDRAPCSKISHHGA